MTFVVGLVIRGDGTDADAALKKTGAAVKQLGEKTEAAGRKTAVAGAAQRKAAGDADMLARSNRIATGSIGNMTAQFNDLIVMTAAGQAPLQMALQQGTQITQAYGQMGAGGAVRMLGGAFLSLLSPMNLITIGGIAAGAALVQWLTGAGDKAVSLEDQVKGLAEQIDRYRDAAGRANASTADMAKEFGAGAEAARGYLREMAEIERREAVRQTRAAAGAVRGEVAVQDFWNNERSSLTALFGQSMASNDTGRIINPVLAAFDAVANATGIEAQVAALETLRDRFNAAAKASGSYSAAEDAALRQINELLIQQQRLMAEIGNERRGMMQRQASEYLAERAGERGDSPRDVARRKGNQAAQADIDEMRQKADLQQLITRYGEDSLQVAIARHQAERDVYAALTAQRGASADMKLELLAAWDAANKIAGVNLAQHFSLAVDVAQMLGADLTAAWNAANGVAGANMAGPISAAANAAAGLAGFLQAAVAAAWAAAGARAAYSAETGGGRGPGTGGPSPDPYGFRTQISRQNAWKPPTKIAGTGGAAAGGGASAVRSEADAVGELIARLRGEIEVARETDPVQRELLELRKELTGATGAQRAEVENLIRSRHAEAEAMETLNYVSEQAGDALVDALMGADGAGKQLIQTLLRAVAQAALLGTGPLASLFGGKGLFGSTPGGGGILGAIVGSIFTKKAGGGWIDGPGGPTDDRIPALVSNGEFIVRASAAARNRAALEAINGGFVPRFAGGGFVGGGGRLAAAAGHRARPVCASSWPRGWSRASWTRRRHSPSMSSRRGSDLTTAMRCPGG